MKKDMKIKIFTASALLLLMTFGCTEKFEEWNTPSNLVTEDLVNVNLMLTRVQMNAIVSGPTGMGGIGNYSGMSVADDNRPFLSGDAPGVWNSAYGSYLNNLSEIIRLCNMDPEKAPDLVNKIAIARIMKAWAFANVTDTYGDIPYSESCLPKELAIYHPKYDTQESIYTDLLKELKEAALQLDPAKVSYGNADLIYKGDPAKWVKLANSLRLRLALRVRYVNATLATANMSDLTEANLITSISDNAVTSTISDFPEHQNTEYVSLVNRGYPHESHYPGKTLVDLLKDNNDPRIGIYIDTARATFPGSDPEIDYFGYRGHPLLGLVPIEEKYPYQYESCSLFAPFWSVPNIEKPVIRSSEVYFALAEAALFGIKGSAADANTYYQKGIDEAIAWAQSFYDKCKSQMGPVNKLYYSELISGWNAANDAEFLAYKAIKQADIDAFKASAVYTLSGTQEEQLEQLMNQKMIALFPLEDQGWAEWRRTGYPRVLVGSDDDDLQGVSPRRMPWPNSEQTLNSEKYDEALERQNGDNGRLVKIWWDANPLAQQHPHPGTVERMDNPWVSTK